MRPLRDRPAKACSLFLDVHKVDVKRAGAVALEVEGDEFEAAAFKDFDKLAGLSGESTPELNRIPLRLNRLLRSLLFSAAYPRLAE
jgi:hypothetical protein